MRRYKAVVIDFKKILHKTAAVSMAMLITVATFYIMGSKLLDISVSPERILKSSMNVIDTSEEGYMKKKAETMSKKFLTLILGFTPNDENSIIRATIPVMAAASDNPLIEIAEKNETNSIPIAVEHQEPASPQPMLNIPEANKAPIKTINATQKVSDKVPVAIANETSYGVDIDEMLSSKPKLYIKGDRPEILITHTHATESYAQTDAEFYDITASDRNNDTSQNVVAVGKRMKEVFQTHGIETIHDEILHDAPSFNGSYAHSLKTVEEYMEKYPSIQIVLDIHRDSIVYDDKTKAKVVTEINGKKAAQLMFVVGTDANGLYHPNWRNNMKSALHFQTCITDKYPTLMRHINLRRERFNGHTSSASMIIEVGTSGNSLDEALFSAELAAECIADYLISL